MAKKNLHNNYRLIFFLVGFLIFCGGIQSVSGCLLPEDRVYNSEIRVDSCHLIISQKEVPPCCQIEACHKSTPVQRDLGGPEYHNQFKDSHSLVYEPRPLNPQVRAGKPFITNYSILPHFSSLEKSSLVPRQSLYSLRTIVLLN